MQPLESWGRYPLARQAAVPVHWRSDPLPTVHGTLLPFGQGRSYGDCCLNEGGTLLATSRLDRFIEFDPGRGVLRCEAGTRLGDILAFAVPRGFFLPVLPGTRFVSVGGAIANDIHGKNHFRAGTFGRHVLQLELLRSSGERTVCSAEQNAELFAATVGGLGLTGLVTWAELQLRPVQGPFIDTETVPFSGLDEFLAIDADSSQRYEYTVAWIDPRRRGLCGLYFRGDHSARPGKAPPPREPAAFPFDLPEVAVSGPTVAAFNALYYARGRLRSGRKLVRYASFFFPLDAIGRWNRLYGKRGLLQFQCVVRDPAAVRALLDRIASSGLRSTLGVLKTFGEVPSPGILSFPRPGATLALDFPNRGADTFALLDALESMVREAGGALYAAKDARMSPATFAAAYPRAAAFERHVDPAFSSSLWRRVRAA
ncbi:MAG TPA: FAD-binding oxidoreductase [Myxococcales bacterium]|nr:FAD-binding oxidoreductase [Myxococcales bacterium]